MITLFTILWLLCGIIAVWRQYHGSLKNWYNEFNESYWDFDKREGGCALRILLIFSPVFILGGLISIVVFEIALKENSWWFTTKNK